MTKVEVNPRGSVEVLTTKSLKSTRIDKELASLLLLLAFPATVPGAVIAIIVGASRNYVFIGSDRSIPYKRAT